MNGTRKKERKGEKEEEEEARKCGIGNPFGIANIQLASCFFLSFSLILAGSTGWPYVLEGAADSAFCLAFCYAAAAAMVKRLSRFQS